MIGCIGLGKLGLPLALFLSKEYDVIGIEKNKEFVHKINNKVSPIREPGVPELLVDSDLRASTDYKDLKGCEVIFIVLPTPSKPDFSFDDSYLIEAIKEIDKHNIKADLIINSTVRPGTCEKLQRLTNNNIVYNPFFIALGNVLYDLAYPDFVLIGGHSDKLLEIYGVLGLDKLEIKTHKEAEIIKLTLNSFVTMKINYANMLGEISEKAGVNVDNITNTLSKDRRIGGAYLKSGLPYGGTCFPRDNLALAEFLESLKINASLPLDVHMFNKRRIRSILKLVNGFKGNNVLILGKGYKSNTPIDIEAPSKWIADELKGYNIDIIDTTQTPQITKRYDLIILASQDKFCTDLTKEQMRSMINSEGYILDCWRIKPEFKDIFNYKAIGDGNE